MKYATIFGGVAVVALIVAGVLFINPQKEVPLGSVGRTGEYFSTTTVYGHSNIINIITATSSTSSPALGRTLGSIIITSSTAVKGFTVVDGNTFVTDTIAVFNSNPTVGTYTFDRFIRYGLIIVVPAGFDGNIVTTYR